MLEKRQLFLRSYQFCRKKSLTERIKGSLVRAKKIVWLRLRSACKLRRFIFFSRFKCAFYYRRRRFFQLLHSNNNRKTESSSCFWYTANDLSSKLTITSNKWKTVNVNNAFSSLADKKPAGCFLVEENERYPRNLLKNRNTPNS
ncbi:hypothetical protein E2542_SST23896 [Spatholobus suberectus]|nr:hypothetical protein E2542_SST23896 [Spatholobus suberectus]